MSDDEVKRSDALEALGELARLGDDHIACLTTERGALSADLDKVRAVRDALQASLRLTNTHVEELESERDALTGEVEHLQQRLRTFSDEEEATVARLRAEVDDAEHGYATIKRELTELREAAWKLSVALSGLRPHMKLETEEQWAELERTHNQLAVLAKVTP